MLRKAGSGCLYDWADGARGYKLSCVSHSGAQHTVFRLASSGHDPLLDLYKLRMLTGQALVEARRLAEKSQRKAENGD